ncbi:MAG TPA: hypothetical protein VJ418_27030 [Streptosporangiaceae bacterium]|jgi:hypothetical protein|nr:hypothetical protein [Streptosporangiaceae bacterium]
MVPVPPELGELLADLPATGAPVGTSSSGRLRPSSGRGALPSAAALIGIGIAAVVLVNVAHGTWGLIWLLLPVLLIARRVLVYRSVAIPYIGCRRWWW